MLALIVDDSRAMRRVLRSIVQPLGVQVIEAASGIEGLERLSENPDTKLAIVDWNMPVMNGLDMVKSVRGNSTFSKLKIVMISTESEPAIVARAMTTGVDEFLLKPFTPDMLLKKLQSVGAN